MNSIFKIFRRIKRFIGERNSGEKAAKGSRLDETIERWSRPRRRN